MTLHIGNAVPKVKSEETDVALQTKTHNDNAPEDLFRIMERATPCSLWVFYGLLAWAILNVHTLSTEDTQELALCRADLGETFTSFTES